MGNFFSELFHKPLAAVGHLVGIKTPHVPSPPGPSPEEQQLRQKEEEYLQTIIDYLKEQKSEIDVLQQTYQTLTPQIFTQLGYDVQIGDNGAITDIKPLSEEEMLQRMSPLQRDMYNIAKQTAELNLKALKGELPVSPALEANLQKQKQLLQETLSRQLGPNWQSTTPGIQAMNEFEKNAELLREEARRGMLTTSSGLLTNAQNRLRTGISDIVSGSQIGLPGLAAERGLLATGTGLAGAYSNLANRYYQDRYLQWQSMLANAQLHAGMQQSLLNLIGTIGGVYLGARLIPTKQPIPGLSTFGNFMLNTPPGVA